MRVFLRFLPLDKFIENRAQSLARHSHAYSRDFRAFPEASDSPATQVSHNYLLGMAFRDHNVARHAT